MTPPPLPPRRLQSKTPGAPSAPNVVIRADRNIFTFGANVLEIAERSACPDWIPPYREDKGVLGADGLVLRSGGPESGPECEARRDSVDRDERRLGELGKRTVEMLAIAHIFCEKLEVGVGVWREKGGPCSPCPRRCCTVTAMGPAAVGPACCRLTT